MTLVTTQSAGKRRVYVRSKPPTACACGQVIANRASRHFSSTFHLQHERIRALLAKDCISLAEIARRVGVSRQRVHQLAKNIFGVQGRIRRKACRLTKKAETGPGKHWTIANEAAQQAREAGLGAELIRVANRSRPWAVSIRGVTCLVRTASHLLSNGVERGYSIRGITLMQASADFALIRIDAETWMVLPCEKLPRRQTAFAWPLRHPEMGAKSCRHDWRQYINAWHLLKGPNLL